MEADPQIFNNGAHLVKFKKAPDQLEIVNAGESDITEEDRTSYLVIPVVEGI